MNRPRTIPLLALILLPATLAVAMGSAETPAASPPNANALYKALKPTLVFADGDVRVDGKPADIGFEFLPGQTLSTGKLSTAEIAFGGANVIAVRPDTVLRLDLEGTNRIMSIEKGAAAAVLKKLGRASGGSLDLYTPAAVAGVRGTCFYVAAREDGSTYFCLCNGSLHLEDAAGGHGADVSAAEHRAFVFVPDGAGGYTLESAGLIDHDSASVDRLAAALGATVDWQAPERE